MKLHGYFRSSGSYRVRIALNLKGLSAEHLSHHLRKGEQRDPSYLAINPQVLACDTHPVQNLKVLARLRQLGLPEEKVTEWAAWANREGLSACEALIANEPGPFCFGNAPTIADLCLVPQLANARRFGVDVAAFPRLLEAETAAKNLGAFADAAPERQPDAE